MKALTGIQVNINCHGEVVSCVFFRGGEPHYYHILHRQSQARRIIQLARTKFGVNRSGRRGGDAYYGEVVRYFYGEVGKT